MTSKKISLILSSTTLTAFSLSAQAVTWDSGDWKLALAGNVNAHYVYTTCDAGDLQSGGTTLTSLQCAGAADEDGNPDDVSSVQNGLLPAALVFSAGTNQEGYDLNATVGVYYGTNSNEALGFSTVDARQVFLTFGNEGMGSFKFGRDFGLFGIDAILADMSLIGIGAGFTPAEPGHTTLGGLGFGYVYADRLTQINYTTPSVNGVTGTIGIFQPMDANGGNSGSNPGIHGKVSYGWKGSVPGSVSATFLTQDIVTDAGTSESITGFDLFGKIAVGDIGVAGSFFSGEGMSTLALGGLVLPGFDATDGTPEESQGYMLQGTYTLNKTKLGLNYSFSESDELVEVENTRITVGAYHSLTANLTLLAEFSSLESELTAGSDESNSFNVGAFMSF
ncbi:MAG: porin [Candidatus Thiodiazotropha lotti]|uniref:Porin n=1 Tax=Candidatus Thiodiazotropha lotti TaxID=2792787 RepID=A0A9E4K2L1_9GAMM|nr:porin [Candidatus Thiodiazotropha lotti]MCW4202055.1 porin [Candidatus Thiodiazotropha lotti]